MGFATWSEAVTPARDRAGWRRQINGPILSKGTYEVKKETCQQLTLHTAAQHQNTDNNLLHISHLFGSVRPN